MPRVAIKKKDYKLSDLSQIYANRHKTYKYSSFTDGFKSHLLHLLCSIFS